MSDAKPPFRERAERLYLSFFAKPTDGTSAGIFRLMLGALAIWQAIAIGWNLRRFFAHDGLVPWEIVKNDRFIWAMPFGWAPKSDAMLYGQAIIFAAAAVCLFVGFRPRIATVVVAYLHASFQVRNPFILNSGDRLFMIVAALAVLVPLGHRYSIDALLRARANRPAPLATMWGQRIIGIQIAYVYLNSAFAKLANERWRNGMALRDVLSSPVFAEWPRYIDIKPLIWFFTYSTLLFELSFPLGVWFKRYRPYLLLWGVGFHIGIDVTMVIPIFSAIMIASYPVYLTDDEAKWVLARLRSPSLLLPRRQPAST
ncbi:MAG: HTTM domain-containing protein [Polyangiaceae bacterium]|nr:HTTM domain-containing protein [Polyangiaceae bacterium]